MLTTYHPEMGMKKPEGTQIEARSCRNGYRLVTALALKGRGIKFIKTYRPEDLTAYAQEQVGFNSYQVTDRAFEIIEAAYNVALESLLE